MLKMLVANRSFSIGVRLSLSSLRNGSRYMYSSFACKKLTVDDLNQHVVDAKYAVRGSIPLRAQELEKQLIENPGSLPFDEIIYANIGNPQQLKQKPLTFYREVLSLLQYPTAFENEQFLIDSKLYNRDAIARAKHLLKSIGGSVGVYSNSQGVYEIRETVAKFISRRDGNGESDPDDIYLTGGASAAVSFLLTMLSNGPKSGVLIPIPQYPLYTATLTLNNTKALPYYLNEEDGWSTDVDGIEKTVEKSLSEGVKPVALVVINPGNPTGSILDVSDMEKLLKIAAKHGIVVISDEVYQENVFEGSEFHSMKQVLNNLMNAEPEVYKCVQLASLHSVSKGISGECGQRGGYMELTNFEEEVKAVLLKLCSISLCSVVTGQALVDLMVSPPQKGDESYEVDQAERSAIHKELASRSMALWKAFNEMEGVSCQKPEGALYLFPKLDLPKKAIQEAEKLDIPPDEFYCKSLLEATGICTVPGSGFGQVEGTHHLRTTFLAPGTEWVDLWKKYHAEFYDQYRD